MGSFGYRFAVLLLLVALVAPAAAPCACAAPSTGAADHCGAASGPGLRAATDACPCPWMTRGDSSVEGADGVETAPPVVRHAPAVPALLLSPVTRARAAAARALPPDRSPASPPTVLRI